MTTQAAADAGAQNNTGAQGNANAGAANQGGTILNGGQPGAQQQGNQGAGDGGKGGGGNPGDGGNGGASAQLFDAGKIKLPDGWKLDDGQMKDFLPLATKLKLDQGGVQELVDLQVKGIQGLKTQWEASLSQEREQGYTEVQDGWVKSLQADKLIGGPKMKENIETAMRAIRKFGDAELSQLFDHHDPVKNPNGLGLGNNPALVRAFFKIGQLISEDNFGAQRANNDQKPDAAQLLFGAGTEVKSGG